MNPTKFALDRPVTVLMVFLAVILIGFISWQRLSLELLPSINYPQITILTTYENAAAPEIESLISKPIEEAVGTIKGIKRITSLSKEGISLVTLDFEWGTDTNLSTLDVREKLDVIKGFLPEDVGNPIIVKFDPSSMPIVTLGISGKSAFEELSRVASKEIKQKLERVPGVALARIGGGVEREILVAVDQGRLFAYGIPISAVIEKLKTANLNFPGGSIESGKAEIRIRTIGRFESLEEAKTIVLKRTDKKIPIFLKDVAIVRDTFKDRTSSFLINGNKSIGISIYKQADANTVNVADGIIREVTELQRMYNPRVQITPVYNQATFIKDSIADLELAGILGAVLAFTVLLFFLQSFQSALIVTTAIPISVLGVFALMYMTGLTLNIMSLGGLALGVGLLVDNGIVILENIHRHRKTNPDVYQAVIQGSSEMQNPVIASTLAHIIVFLPILFVKGLSGKFFIQLALTISFSLIISILVALLLNPMLEAKRGFFHSTAGEPGGYPGHSRQFGGDVRGLLRGILKPIWQTVDLLMRSAQSFYLKIILAALNHRKKVVLLAFFLLILSFSLLPFMGKEYIPNVDRGNFDIELTLPRGTALDATEAVALRIGEQISKLREVKDVFVNIGHDATGQAEKAMGESDSNVAKMTVLLNEMRQRSVGELVKDLRAEISKYPEIQAEYILNQNVGRMLRQKQDAPEILVISGPDLKTLRQLTDEVISRLSRNQFLKDLKASLAGEEAEIQISVYREKAASFGLTVKSIADTLKTAMHGKIATKYFDGDQEVDIVVKLRDEDRNEVSKLEKLLIHTPINSDIALTEVAGISPATRLRQIQRHDLKRVSVISANILGMSFNEAIENVKADIEKIKLPPNHTIAFSSEQEQMNRSFRNLKFALLLSILLVYMLLASLFESFLNPFIIMFAVPLAAVGVILILFIFSMPISMGVYIGSIMLGGIVVNNSIILIDYTDRLRKRGLPCKEAIIQAGNARLRPILMTAMTTIIGLVPLAVGFGGGSEIRSPLAITVIGGLTTSTFMTLVIIPVIYSLFGDLKPNPDKLELNIDD